MSVVFYGDYDTTETVHIPFNTFTSDDPSASSTITDLAAGDIEIHKDGSTTQRSSDNGVTVSIDFDSITGNHMIHIDLSDNTDAGFYSAGSRYAVRIEGTTVDGATINAWIGSFSIGCTLRPTVDGRTLDVTETGAAGIDWGNVENPSTSVDLSATAIDLCDEVTVNTDMRGTDSAALAATALSNATWTDTRAGYIDNINGHTAQTGDGYSLLSNITYGLSALKTIIDTLATAANLATVDTVVDGIKAVTDNLPDSGALTALLSSIASILTDTNELQTDLTNGGRLDLLIDGIKSVTDALPDSGALTSLATAVNLATVDTVVDAIKVVTDNIPDSGALTALLASIAAIKAKTDNQPAGVKKNVALNNFPFVMIDSTDHLTPKTGLTITAEISKDGGAFASAANSASELGSGVYLIDWTQTEINADTIVLKFTASGADQKTIIIKTSA